MPQPSVHIAYTLPLAAALPRRLRAAVFAGGVLIDTDHFVDLVFARRYAWARGRSFVVLHGLDVLAVLAAVAWWRRSERLGAVLLGAAVHHALDYANERNWVKVSLVWRASRRFRAPGVRRDWMHQGPLRWF